MKTFIWFFVGLFLTTAGAAQGLRTIKGKVVDNTNAPLIGAVVVLKGKSNGTTTDANGDYSITIPSTGKHTLVFSFVGYMTQKIEVKESLTINVTLKEDVSVLRDLTVVRYGELKKAKIDVSQQLQGKAAGITIRGMSSSPAIYGATAPSTNHDEGIDDYNTEEYDALNENIFHSAKQNPLSTFSIDVDAASYSNVRRFINMGQRPPKDAVRIEEMVNYFNYDYAQPKDDVPFAVHTEVSTAPWNSKHRLVSIGLQGRNIPTQSLPPSNLVFLIDVSGSMSDVNKLPLLKSSLKILVEALREEDHVAIVVYAGAAGLVLEPTSGKNKSKIIAALDNLEAGGSTAGGEGINLAYAVAKENFKKDGNNRVILATDGDFNVGESSNASMERLIESKRKEGVFLTVLGYGMGNYKDSKMEILADKGNGNYAYIDNITEARKVLVSEFGGTLFTIAKDVKLQIEFNPTIVKAYRLIGYENRMLKSEDFNNDKKDAGELGSGHTVTALYEIIPVGVDSDFYKIDSLKYQTSNAAPDAKTSGELMTIKLRYKNPTEDVSALIVHSLIDTNVDLSKTSDNFKWSASVAAFGMLLRESEYVKDFSYQDVVNLAQQAKGKDEEGYRIEFINMVKAFSPLARR
jgi:Ca-activated chloride channel homolog